MVENNVSSSSFPQHSMALPNDQETLMIIVKLLFTLVILIQRLSQMKLSSVSISLSMKKAMHKRKLSVKSKSGVVDWDHILELLRIHEPS